MYAIRLWWQRSSSDYWVLEKVFMNLCSIAFSFFLFNFWFLSIKSSRIFFLSMLFFFSCVFMNFVAFIIGLLLFFFQLQWVLLVFLVRVFVDFYVYCFNFFYIASKLLLLLECQFIHSFNVACVCSFYIVLLHFFLCIRSAPCY